MKKGIFPLVVLFAVVCSLFVTGCETGNTTPVEHTDPAFLVGKWSLGDKSFTIEDDLTFVCNVMVPVVYYPAQVSGKLDATADSPLGEHDYILRNMTAGNTDDTIFGKGNEALNTQLGAFINIVVTLKPNSDKNEFTFSTGNMAAGIFFGGTYVNQTETVEHTDPSFLEGKWSLGDKSFTIEDDLTFVCNVMVGSLKAQVNGKLHATGDLFGEHDYIFRNLTAGDPDDTIFGSGNVELTKQLAGYNGIKVTVKPNEDKTAFTFSTGNAGAALLFNGTYTK